MTEEAPKNRGAVVGDQLLRECRAMAAYAFGSGLKVPEVLVGDLERAEALFRSGSSGKPGPAPPSGPSGRAAKLTKIPTATSASGSYKADPLTTDPSATYPSTAVSSAADPSAVDPPSGSRPEGSAVEILARVHNRLAEIVSPATPRTILLLAEEEKRSSVLRFLGAVPLIRRLLLVAFFSMCAFIWISLSSYVDGSGFDLLKNSGFKLLLSELFLISAASIGVSFANLFEAQRYIKDGTFDPKYESSYWVRHVLGLMAGTILALLVPIEALAGEQESSSIVQQLGQPMLALLGGFSASAVHRILSRIVAALEGLVKGDTRDLVAAQDRVAKAKLAERETQSRMELSSQLIHLEQELSGSGDPEEALKSLRDFQQRLIRGE